MTLIRSKYSPSIALDVGHLPMGRGPAPPALKDIRGRDPGFGSRISVLARRISGAISLPTRSALVLELKGQVVRFNDPETFEFSLVPRTQFPAARVARLINWPAEDLERMAAKIRQVEQRFAEAIAASVERPAIIGALLRRLSLKLFSQDHDWRDIIAALNRYGSAYDAYKKIALVKYTQYLRARQEILRSIYIERRGAAPFESPVQARDHDSDETRFAGARETGLFRSTLMAANSPGGDLNALPRGETISLYFSESREMSIRLSSHDFKLVAGKNFFLKDEYGSSFLIRPGKNLVGRHIDCDVVIQPFYRGVSRKHLIIEPVSEKIALVTDLSSHGTYVPSNSF